MIRGVSDQLRLGAWVILLCGVFLLGTILFPSQSAAQVLDHIEIVETPTTAEIHIVFNTRALYLRHTPSEKGDLIRVFLDFPDQDRSRRFARELAASPPSDLIPKFTVTFPDQGTNGLSVRFERPVRFRVSQRGIRSASRIVIAVKLERPVVPSPVPPEVKMPTPTPPVPSGPKQTFDIPPFRPGMEVEKYAADLMKLGQAALAAEEPDKAVQIFNALRNLPCGKSALQPRQQLRG